MNETMTVHMNNEPIYDIVFRRNFDDILQAMEPLDIRSRRICIVSDLNVSTIYLEELKAILEPACKEVMAFTFMAGEENKNLDVVKSLYESLIVAQFDRRDLLLALGGGVVGDLTGFAAATYLRGIDFIQVPTSLLAQVDSSIGGKTGVDFSSYKNMVGAFHMPKLVYMNVGVLKTLPDREYYSGLGEIIKHGLIKDAEYFDWLCNNIRGIKTRDPEVLIEMIKRSCEVKRQVVEKDPTEQGERALLNFGHTLGHAVEKLQDFTYLHGECVIMGMIFAAKLSMQKQLIDMDCYEKICDLITSFPFPDFPETLDFAKVVKTTKNDKKMSAGKIKFVLIRDIGDAFIDMSVEDTDMENAMRAVYEEIN